MSHRLHGGAVCVLLIAWVLPSGVSIAQGQTKDAATGAAIQPAETMDPALAADWMRRWKQNILREYRDRSCDREMGEELGWLVSPVLNGLYDGYLATGDREWVDRLFDWGDSIVKRGVKEPDGYIGWPKSFPDEQRQAGVEGADSITDSELGEAMFLRPLVLMAGEILKTPALKKDYGAKAEEYIRLSEQMFEKWDSRGAWRETKGGGLWIDPPFGLDPKTGKFTAGYAERDKGGVSHPANKENIIAIWIIGMYDVTHKPVYKERAEKWWRLMKSRMKLRDNGKYFVWNYWDVGGPWDFQANGSLRYGQWVGVHPNGGYYGIDVEGIVTAYEHGLVFTKEDITRLIATNRDFMWNQQIKDAKFQRIDGEPPVRDLTPGVLWEALAPYDPTLRKIFEANHDPGDWGGLGTPAWVARYGRRSEAGQ
ncbi:MAG: hypothetical protein ABSA67_19215 [Candidatus Brocadiia bacterium]|jgi:hypothetical protein